ncbi:MAG: phosphate ABC transporter substrate-binding protein [Candidatus Binatia bacterium]
MFDRFRSAAVCTSLVFVCVACTGGDSSRTVIQNKGSDTLVNLAQAWAERYSALHNDVAVAVSGGGSGTGIAALINGNVDIANASRDIKEEEQEAVRKAHGQEAVEHVVARDAIVVFVHKDNPVPQLSLAQLACIYGEGGTCERWTDLGVEVPGCAGQEIIRVSRQSNSGTYVFFRETVLGKTRDFELGSRDMQGSKDVVDLVTHTPCAIGYSGMGYATAEVKSVCVAKNESSACVNPTPEAADSGLYPIARKLYMYTLGEPVGVVRDYLDWITSKEGQEIVVASGFVPVN